MKKAKWLEKALKKKSFMEAFWEAVYFFKRELTVREFKTLIKTYFGKRPSIN